MDASLRSVEGAGAAAHSALEVSDGVKAEAGRTRQELDGMAELLRSLRGEFGTLTADAREAVEQLRAAVDEARPVPTPNVTPQPAATVAEPEALAPNVLPNPATEAPPRLEADELPDVEVAPAEELTEDARDRLVRPLKDAWSIETEQVDLLRAHAEAVDDAGLRTLLHAHGDASRRQQRAVGERVTALGGEPGGGRGLVGQLAARLWEALQAPRDTGDEAVDVALKAFSAAEFEAGVYLAVHALARTMGDAETAAAHSGRSGT